MLHPESFLTGSVSETFYRVQNKSNEGDQWEEQLEKKDMINAYKKSEVYFNLQL